MNLQPLARSLAAASRQICSHDGQGRCLMVVDGLIWIFSKPCPDAHVFRPITEAEALEILERAR